MRIYRWELLAVCHHPDKSCDHRHCDCGDIMFLICHMTSRKRVWWPWSNASGDIKYWIKITTELEKVLKISRDLTNPSDWRVTLFHESSSLWYLSPPCQVWRLEHRGSWDIILLVCHVIYQDHMIKGSSKYIDRSPLKVTTLPSSVAIGIAVVEI